MWSHRSYPLSAIRLLVVFFICIMLSAAPANAYVTAASLSMTDIANNYALLISTAITSYRMRLNLLCTSGACMSNPSAFIAGIEVGNIPVTIRNSGRTVDGYPTVPTGELFGVYTYADSPIAVSVTDGQSYRWPLRLNYTRFVNGSAPAMFANRSQVPTFVAKASLESLLYYGQQAATSTSWFDPAAFGPNAASDPIANVSAGTFVNGGTSRALTNFTNISYAIQFSVFNNLTINSTNILVPTEFYVRETFGVFYHDHQSLDSEGFPTVRRVPGPPGTIVSTWYVKLSDFDSFIIDTAAIAQRQQLAAALALWNTMLAPGSGMSFYSFLMNVDCVGGACALSPPEFIYNSLGITANVTGLGTDFVWKIVDPLNNYAPLTTDPNASATAKTLSRLHAYAAALASVNAMGNGYPSVGATVVGSQITELWYNYDEQQRGLNSFPSAFGYSRISRSEHELPFGYSGMIPFGPPTRPPSPTTNLNARYTIRTSVFTPNTDFVPVGEGNVSDGGNRSGRHIDRTLIIVIVVVGVFLLLCIIILVICACCRHRRERRKEADMQRKKELAMAPDNEDDEEMEDEEEDDEIDPDDDPYDTVSYVNDIHQSRSSSLNTANRNQSSRAPYQSNNYDSHIGISDDRYPATNRSARRYASHGDKATEDGSNDEGDFQTVDGSDVYNRRDASDVWQRSGHRNTSTRASSRPENDGQIRSNIYNNVRSPYTDRGDNRSRSYR